MAKKIVLNEKDNVYVAAEDTAAGMGHKYALRNIKKGEKVVKYGFPIGVAVADIKKGEHVHTHNLKTALEGIEDYNFKPLYNETTPRVLPAFNGYLRDDGRAGTRNEIWIVCTVGCVNAVARRLEYICKDRYKDIDGVAAATHPYGCSQTGKDLTYTQRILGGIVRHPNAGGVLVLSLGCENNNIGEFKKILGETGERIKFLALQETDDDIADSLTLLDEIYELCRKDKRVPLAPEKLIAGLKCGGSDALSGITANKLLGGFSDAHIAGGGTSILTEVPEMFGSEETILARCKDKKTFEDVAELINDFKRYYIENGQKIYENPSPGNRAGGITTLEEKSLGCTNKSGFSKVTGVSRYGECISARGLNLLESPGNDIVAQTALLAAGANLILFTTGRGTPLGALVPTVKVSSNSKLYAKKSSWIDFDAGVLLEKDFEEILDGFIGLVYETASGKRTKNEINGYKEIAVFKGGVTL